MAYPDLRIRGGGGGGVSGHPDPGIRGGGGFPKKFFLSLPQFGLKIRVAGPPGPSPIDLPLQQYKKQRHTGF